MSSDDEVYSPLVARETRAARTAAESVESMDVRCPCCRHRLVLQHDGYWCLCSSPRGPRRVLEKAPDVGTGPRPHRGNNGPLLAG